MQSWIQSHMILQKSFRRFAAQETFLIINVEKAVLNIFVTLFFPGFFESLFNVPVLKFKFHSLKILLIMIMFSAIKLQLY